VKKPPVNPFEYQTKVTSLNDLFEIPESSTFVLEAVGLLISRLVDAGIRNRTLILTSVKDFNFYAVSFAHCSTGAKLSILKKQPLMRISMTSAYVMLI
jgi:hypothetical protein